MPAARLRSGRNLLGKTVFRVIPLEDAARLKAIRAELLLPGQVDRAEWENEADGRNLRTRGTNPTSCRMAGGRRSCGTSASASASSRHCRNRRSDSGSLSMKRRSGWRSLGSMGISSVSIVSSARSSATSSAETDGNHFPGHHPSRDLDLDDTAREQLARGVNLPIPPRKARHPQEQNDRRRAAQRLDSSRSIWCPLYFIAQIEDITERKRAEEALRVVSAELRQTLHTAGTGLTHCSRDLRFLSANPAYVQYIGLPLEQIVGRPMVEVMGQAAFEIIRPRIERVLSGERVEYEVEMPIAGERKWIHAVYTPDQDASGNVVGWVASVTDITERKRVEEELKAANAFLDAIIENIPLMLFIKESQSLRFVRLNRAAEDLLGWPKQTLIGKNAYDYWPKEQAEFFVEKDRETLKSGNIVDIPEEPIQTRYRGVRILHTKKVPILDTAGNPIYLLGISEDITERKRIEKEQQFLAEVSVALSASLEYEQTLATLARLVVQNIADWSAVDVIDEQGQLSRLKVASADPDQGRSFARFSSRCRPIEISLTSCGL